MQNLCILIILKNIAVKMNNTDKDVTIWVSGNHLQKERSFGNTNDLCALGDIHRK